ncbi:hypothetical protein [Streptomyces sp. MB09-02B]|nr:hypothetical protein [Streptomyces sp. MB09-02B]MDX3645004.1 hypothetical protein [Streptomyces sp. MB09-02B]
MASLDTEQPLSRTVTRSGRAAGNGDDGDGDEEDDVFAWADALIEFDDD